MIKLFETAGAGCAPVVDHLDELTELGFLHGVTCLVYKSFDEAADLLRSSSSQQLTDIGHAAAELARMRHTWAHRAADVRRLLEAA